MLITKKGHPTSSDGLSVSIVIYRPNLSELEATISSLAAACKAMRTAQPNLPIAFYLVNNDDASAPASMLDALAAASVRCEVISGHGNVGYGRGHNMALARSTSRFHLILNPDVVLAEGALATSVRFFSQHSDVGLVTPWIGTEVGVQQHLCRRYPSLLDLLIRGFAPASIRRLAARRLARYEMRDVINDHDIVWDPPIVSGCFMLFRTDVLKQLGGFDPRYFLYFEDYDLSLRTHDVARVAYVPAVRVIHHGGGASRKGFAHIRMFAASAFKFYNRFGWRLW
ncbi:glycosyl transferase [Burkholderia pseudomultivorans]|uniref:glycosyltransferase family 2 protein n=1 Tax=Burkholderia pseudomultivorans TaxID=1207504 RepID=UPI00075755EF|nr:glycosyltransferase family 2 protein [Burkholderia pseudomultivorans]KVC41552.1 glycosyl transferase [Burkholderia pseudomultivorans]